MHTLGAGEYDQRRQALRDQSIKIPCSPVGEHTPVDFGIVDTGASQLQFVTEQVTTLLTAQYQDTFSLNLLQCRRAQQGFTVIGFLRHHAIVGIETARGERSCQRFTGCSADHAKPGGWPQAPAIDEAQRTLDRVAADEEEDVVVADSIRQPLLFGADRDRLDIDHREGEYARAILLQHVGKFTLLVRRPGIQNDLPLQPDPG